MNVRWKGYPDGLAGEAIPLEAGIDYGPADAFDAMTQRETTPQSQSPFRCPL